MHLKHPDALGTIVSSGAVSDDLAETLKSEANELVDVYTATEA